ncbi:uncharacterized protein LOC142861192 [Microcebus murinus]|uniref:uncharacterized protein LOC142861192 n=1 Tax=Microcebus murinus TaxID=30608 RepID=UPI003F6AA5AA
MNVSNSTEVDQCACARLLSRVRRHRDCGGCLVIGALRLWGAGGLRGRASVLGHGLPFRAVEATVRGSAGAAEGRAGPRNPVGSCRGSARDPSPPHACPAAGHDRNLKGPALGVQDRCRRMPRKVPCRPCNCACACHGAGACRHNDQRGCPAIVGEPELSVAMQSLRVFQGDDSWMSGAAEGSVRPKKPRWDPPRCTVGSIAASPTPA